MSFDVSVIVPTYNRSALIAETLQRILDQTVRPREVIVIDDGSTDDTASVVARFRPDVAYHWFENRGVPSARDTGVKLSSSKFIAFCDSDDLWHAEYLRQMSDLFAAAPHLDYAFSNFVEFTKSSILDKTKFDLAPKDFWHKPKHEISPQAWILEGGLIEELIGYQLIFPSATIMSREFYDRIGGFDPTMEHFPSEDLEFTLRCVRHGPIGVIRTPSVQIRKHDGNLSGSPIPTLVSEICVLNHVLNTHDLSAHARLIIVKDVERRCRAAIDLAFSAGATDLVMLLSLAVESSKVSAKQTIKILISSLQCSRIGQGLSRPLLAKYSGQKSVISHYLRKHLYLAVYDIIQRHQGILA